MTWWTKLKRLLSIIGSFKVKIFLVAPEEEKRTHAKSVLCGLKTGMLKCLFRLELMQFENQREKICI